MEPWASRFTAHGSFGGAFLAGSAILVEKDEAGGAASAWFGFADSLGSVTVASLLASILAFLRGSSICGDARSGWGVDGAMSSVFVSAVGSQS